MMKSSEEVISQVIERFNGFRQFKTVYDIGAHHGIFTKTYSPKLPNASFFCFEANKDKPSTIGDYRWFRTVLSNEDDKIVGFYEKKTGYNTGDSYYKQTTGYDKVKPKLLKTKTLDTMIKENNIPLPDLIKIDTQGSELDILSAASMAIESCKIILCEIPAKGVTYNFGAPSHEEYMDFFQKMGFKNHRLIKDLYTKKDLTQHDVAYYK